MTNATPKSFDERMAHECKIRGVTSTLFKGGPGGGSWLYISVNELDITRAFMTGMFDMLTERGIEGTNGPVTVRRIQAGLIVTGKEYFWSVNNPDGSALVSGYAATDKEARERVAEAFVSTMKGA